MRSPFTLASLGPISSVGLPHRTVKHSSAPSLSSGKSATYKIPMYLRCSCYHFARRSRHDPTPRTGQSKTTPSIVLHQAHESCAAMKSERLSPRLLTGHLNDHARERPCRRAMGAEDKYACGTDVPSNAVGPIRHSSIVHPAAGDLTSDGKSAGSSAFH
jgi:hypothetical protein